MTDRSMPRRQRGGFTLLELLMVVAIIGILAALGTAGYLRMADQAHESATRTLLEELNSALQERLEAFLNETKSTLQSTAYGTAAGGDASRAYLLARLDAMRAEFPQQFMDFMKGDPDGGGAVLADAGGSRVGLALGINSRPRHLGMYTQFLKSTKVGGNFQVDAANPFDPTNAYSMQPDGHDIATESSECLYLILSTKAQGMSFDVSEIPQKYLRDTDEDGLMEIVDSWGRPLRFYRWPTDYYGYLLDVTRQYPTSASVNSMDPSGQLIETVWFGNAALRETGFEEAGFFRLHQAYPNPIPQDLSTTLDSATGAHSGRRDDARLYPIGPMIISAGKDGEFGLIDPADFSQATAARMDLRGARINPANESFVVDNILNIRLVEGENR